MKQHHCADSHGDAIDGRNDRFGVLNQRVLEHHGAGRTFDFVTAGIHEIVEIVPGGEHPGVACDDETAYRRIILRGVDRAALGAVHLLRQGIFLVRLLQFDDADRIFVGHDGLFGHFTPGV